jgi:hypothetical protein
MGRDVSVFLGAGRIHRPVVAEELIEWPGVGAKRRFGF